MSAALVPTESSRLILLRIKTSGTLPVKSVNSGNYDRLQEFSEAETTILGAGIPASVVPRSDGNLRCDKSYPVPLQGDVENRGIYLPKSSVGSFNENLLRIVVPGGKL